MLKKVLIVDDDRILCSLIQNKCKKYENLFRTILAGDGVEAVEQLQKHAISLVVTDLQMPRMDGFSLIAHLSDTYPDIPVIILTGFSTPHWKKAVLKESALEYIEKPFVVEELVETIKDALEKEIEGGILHSISLEMFVQLVQLDNKTCTIRALNKLTDKIGVLFFKNGTLLDARLGEQLGLPAAHEIFSWDDVVLYIQDSCAVEKSKIDQDLQAILMEALRRKDEAEDDETPSSEA